MNAAGQFSLRLDMSERLEEEHLVGARAIRETLANTEFKDGLARWRQT